MAQPDAFAPPGLLEFGGDPPRAELVYRSLVAGVTDPKTGRSPFDLTPGTHYEARLFAKAIMIAGLLAEAERAQNQGDPSLAVDGLPNLEWEYGVTPGANDSIGLRQDRVTAKKAGSKGASRGSVVAALKKLLGPDLVAYVTRADTTLFPTTPGSSAQVHATRAALAPKFWKLSVPVAPVDNTQARWVAYETLDASMDSADLVATDVVMLEPEQSDVGEKLTILAVRTVVANGQTIKEFQAVVKNAHDKGAIVTTMRWPWQMTNGRLQHLVLKAAAAATPTKRAAVNDLMPDIVRVVSQWEIVADTVNATKFTLGPSGVGTPLGTAALGTIAYTPEP